LGAQESVDLPTQLPGLADRREPSIIDTSGQADIPMTVRAMQAGAVELLMKPYVRKY
jgi:FixJ family two-component response regulator